MNNAKDTQQKKIWASNSSLSLQKKIADMHSNAQLSLTLMHYNRNSS